MTRLPYWAWRPWLTPWHAWKGWLYRPRPVKAPAPGRIEIIPLEPKVLRRRWKDPHG